MSIKHAYSQTIADGGATSVVQPSNWNSEHNFVQNFIGNTLGTSQLSGTDLVWAAGDHITLSAVGSTVSIIGEGSGGAAPVTFATYQNRQLGASTTTQFTNNQMWCVPFRVAGGYISASTLQYMQSLSGNFTSAVAATHGATMRWGLYSADATNSSAFNLSTSGSLTWQAWNSGSSSGSWAINGTTSSSAGSQPLSQAAGLRIMNVPFGSSISPGLYMMALMGSTSSAGASNLISRFGMVLDAPVPVGANFDFGAATQTSVGFVDAGTYGTTTGAFPAVITASQIKQHSNLVPYFKIGAL